MVNKLSWLGEKGETGILVREKILPKMAYLVQNSQWGSGEHMGPRLSHVISSGSLLELICGAGLNN